MMSFDLFYVVAGFMVLLISVMWLTFYRPVRNIRGSLHQTRHNLISESKIQGNFTFFLSEGYKIFKNPILKSQWEMYLSSIIKKKGRSEYANIYEYFSPRTMLDETTNTALANYMPGAVFLTGAIMTATVASFYAFTGQLSRTGMLEAGCLVLGVALISVSMSFYYKHLSYKTQEQLKLFCQWISRSHGEIPSISEELADIRMTMESYQREQLKYFAQLSEHIAKTTKRAIKPYLESTKDVIETFVLAATKRQVESMKHLAEYFAKDTTQLYLEQIQKISGTTADMAEIQSRTAETLQSVTTIYTESKDLIRQVGDTTNTALARYDDYMINIEEMQSAVTATVSELKDLVEYIRINSRNQNFTIENLSQFQQNLIDTSSRSTEAMQSFFADFKDQYSSSIIALRAASQDMVRAGEFVKSSYTGLTDDVNQDVTKIFAVFEENLATISVHLSRSILDLQEAIDELPEILKRLDRKEQ